MSAYLLHYFLFFFLLGFLLARITGLGGYSVALALPLSYLAVLLNLAAARLLNMEIELAGLFVYGEILVLLALWIRRDGRGPWAGPGVVRAREILSGVGAALNKSMALLVAGLFALIFAYLVSVGPYTEIPSDFWTHAGKLQDNRVSLLETGKLPGIDDWPAYLGKDGAWWYAVQATMMHLSGITVADSFATQSVVNSMILLAAFFWFASRIIALSWVDRRTVHVTAVVATVLFLFHHGTSIFSFIRYYAFGPAFLNHVVLFAFLALFLDLFRNSALLRVRWYLVLASLLLLMAVVHLQEAMFALVLVYAVLLVHWLEPLFGGRMGDGVPVGDNASTGLSQQVVNKLFYAATVSIGLAVIFVHVTMERYDPLAYSRLIDVNRILPFLKNLYILDPNKQFYETLTPWGYLVIALFVLSFRTFRSNRYLVAGMLTPLITVFNPVFADVFLRVSAPWLLWRFLYMMPLAIVGAMLLVRAIAMVKSGKVWPIRLGGGVVAVSLVVLLLPFETRYAHSHLSRLPTLAPVDARGDHRNWADLFEYLNTLEARYQVMTDPVTGYMIRALTRHREGGRKFDTTMNPGYQALARRELTVERFERFRGWLIVINLRSGAYSQTGALSRHWLPEQLQLERYYPPALLSFIEGNPDRFTRRWDAGDIRVFEVT